MKYLVVGLGNPGPEYELTRHNIGFLIIDNLAEKLGFSFSSNKFGEVALGRLKNKHLVLLKPNTYMNLSGKAVRYWMNETGVDNEGLLIVTDDLALPTGKIRIRTSGSDGGHNGLKSINEVLGVSDYPRLRFGIGSDFPKGRQVDYVLGNWKDEEWIVVKEKISVASEAIETFVLSGPSLAMTEFNKL